MSPRHTKRKCIILSLLALAVMRPAGAASIIDDFSSNAEGWTGNPGEGQVVHVAAGGNPGGHIQVTDIGAGSVNGFASGALAGPAFLGDLTAFDGGTLSLDMATFSGFGGTFASFGGIHIFSGTNVAIVDIANAAPSGVGAWQSYSVAFDAGTWGLSQADWTALLSNVTMIGVATDAFDGGDTIGIDNFSLISATTNGTGAGKVPAPATLLLIAAGLLGFQNRRPATGKHNPV